MGLGGEHVGGEEQPRETGLGHRGSSENGDVMGELHSLFREVIASFATSYIFLIFYFILERREGREKERKRNINVRKNINWLPSASALTRSGAWSPQPRHVP